MALLISILIVVLVFIVAIYVASAVLKEQSAKQIVCVGLAVLMLIVCLLMVVGYVPTFPIRG